MEHLLRHLINDAIEAHRDPTHTCFRSRQPSTVSPSIAQMGRAIPSCPENWGSPMRADDTNYTIVKNGVVVVSGTGPAIRVDGNRLIIRDGPQETSPLCLTRAEASRKLRHVIVCGHAGGFVTFDALRWLRDTGVAFSQLDWDGTVVISSGPRGPDRA